MIARVIFDTACHSDTGGRDEQQDRVEIFARDDALLLVLADGMGGHEGGALAAQAVIDVARERFDAVTRGAPEELLIAIAEGAHDRINAIGAERGIRPHSTCVLLHLSRTDATWAHVGDSRLYRFENGRLVGRTTDHSVVELMRLQGRITEEEMKTHPDQNRLFEALGGNQTPEIETGQSPATARDGFLLASDGLWENVSERELEVVLSAIDLHVALKELVDRAKGKAGPECDNVSVAVARRRRARRSWARRLEDWRSTTLHTVKSVAIQHHKPVRLARSS